jgi:hypothetical protein
MTDPRPARASFLQRLIDRRFWASVGAVVGGVAALTGILAFALDLLPDSGSAACEGPSAASLENPSVQETSLEDFKRRFSSPESGDPTEGYTVEQLETRVKYVSVFVSVEGLKGKPVTLRWSMEDASNRKASGLPRNMNAVTITPPTCQQSRHVEHVLLDPPIPRGRAVFVKLFLLDEEGNELGREKQTKAIRGVD